MHVQNEGGGVKGRLNNVKKTALLFFDGFPYKTSHCQSVMLSYSIFLKRYIVFILSQGFRQISFKRHNKVIFIRLGQDHEFNGILNRHIERDLDYTK